MNENIDLLMTEQNNPCTRQIDQCGIRQILDLINREDQTVPLAVAREIDFITEAVEGIVACLKRGGRLIYIGAGTSGRLGILDASECIPTFGTPPEMVTGIIAGGEQAIIHAVEGAEDDARQAVLDIAAKEVCGDDAVVGVTASGRTPYVLAALQEANERGAFTVGVCNNKNSALSKVAKVTVEAETGPEVVMGSTSAEVVQGSTRMKAGTAQKLILNMLSTCTMIKMGKVYSNYMVDLCATNQKLYARSTRMIRILTDVDEKTARDALEKANGRLKVAILMLKGGVSCEKAAQLLEENDDVLRLALEML